MRFVKNRHWLLITVGTLVWSLTMVKSGLVYNYGMGFWGPNGHDGVWHVALASSLARGSWEMPIFAGEVLKNYHLGFDLLLAVIHRLTTIPISILYFQFFPPLLALAIGWLTYKLTQNNWSVFFVYFGGSLGWVLGKGESAFWSQQAISTLINPPYALSLVILLLALRCLQKQKWILAVILFAVLPQVKIYAGALGFLGLLAASVKNRKLIWVFLGSLVVYLATNYQLLTTSSSLVVWQPGWYLETMMSYSDRVGWARFYSAMTNYRLGGQWAKAILAYGAAFAVFMVGNLGTRVVGMWRIGKNDWMGMFVWSVIGGGIIVPMLFLQKGTPWNTIQFFYYSLFFSGILAGVAVSQIKNNFLKIIIILVTVPTVFGTLKHYLPARPPAKISREELTALSFLSRQPKGTVLTYPDTPDPDAPPPRPLYLYESTAYVAAWSGHPVYLEDEINLNITGYDWPARRQNSLDFFATSDAVLARKFLSDNSISYIYLAEVAKSRPRLSDTQLGMENIFENSRVAIWRIPK